MVLFVVEQIEQDILMLVLGKQGWLYIVIECYSCFDWLMLILDEYWEYWLDVEIDLISGFNFDLLLALVWVEFDLVIMFDL